MFYQIPDLHINEIWLAMPNSIIRQYKLICLLRKVKQSCALYGDDLQARVKYCTRWCYTQEQLNFVEYLQMQVERFLSRYNVNLLIAAKKTGKQVKLYNTIIDSDKEYPKQSPQSWKIAEQKFTAATAKLKNSPKYNDDYKNKFYKPIRRLREAGMVLPDDKVEITEYFDIKKWDDKLVMDGALAKFYGPAVIKKLTNFIKNKKMDELVDSAWIFCQLEKFKNNSK